VRAITYLACSTRVLAGSGIWTVVNDLEFLLLPRDTENTTMATSRFIAGRLMVLALAVAVPNIIIKF
jgi:hypothetical protein